MKTNILIAAVVIGCLGLYQNVTLADLSDVADTLFFMFYVLSIIAVSVICGHFTAVSVYYYKLSSRKKELEKNINQFKKLKTYEIKFSNDAVALHKELRIIKIKIKKIKG